jgi:hypothetical protein
MQTKLTLRMDEDLVGLAKKEARKRGTSVSRMVSDYFHGLKAGSADAEVLPPATSALLGSLRGKRVDRETYRRHLEEKYR